MKRRNDSGFTLIELMVVVAIVGLLAAIAYPAYTDSVRKSNRADAKAALTDLAQRMARIYAENKTYLPNGALPALPYTEIPRDSASKTYDVTLDAAATTASTFALRATPKNAQVHDSCGTLTLDHLGQKHASGTGSRCW